MMPGSSNLYVAPEDIKKARQVDLLSFLKEKDPSQLVHVAGQTYCTLEHDSLKINNGKWYWHSKGFGGISALDYLIRVKGYPLPRAVEIILGIAGPTAPVSYRKAETHPGLLLPEKNRSSEQVIRYLQRRGIHPSIISYCMEKDILYESKNHHNAVFVGYDKIGVPRYAMIRSTTGNYKSEATGSSKRYSFRIAVEESGENLHVFESAIDLLSYATILRLRGCDWRKDALLSLAGVFTVKRKGVLPAAMQGFLEDHEEVKTICLHLDNDQTGRDATEGIQESLSERYEIIDDPPRYGKDANEALLIWRRRHSF